MQHKQVIETYNSLIRQITNKIGKKVNIVYPYGTTNVIIKDFIVSQNMYDRLVKRRDYLVGGDLQWTQQ